MTRRIAVIVATLALMMGTLAMTAGADVDPVSQANCAAAGAPSGAKVQASRDATGRPDALIPVTASDGKTRGQGGAASANGTNCGP